MRALALMALLSLAGCMVYTEPEPDYPPAHLPPPTQPPPARPPPPPPAQPPAPPPVPEARPAPAPAPQYDRYRNENEVVDLAFRIARDRGLVVDRVVRTHLDEAGRWQVELRGPYDRARLLIDSRDGRLLKGKFRSRGGRPGDRG